MSTPQSCPYCGQQHQTDGPQPAAGAKVLCSGCSRIFTLRDAIFTPPASEPQLAPADPRTPQSYQPVHRLLVEEEKTNEPQISTATAAVAVGLLICGMLIFICGGIGIAVLRSLRDQ